MVAPDRVANGFGETDLRAVVADTLHDLHPGVPGLPELRADASLDRDLGLDSLARMELLLRIEAAAGVALPEDTLQGAETIADLWCAVQRARPASGGGTRAATAALAHAAAPAPQVERGAARTLLDVLDAHVRVQGQRTQIVHLADDTETPISYAGLAAGADAVAAGLQRAGLQPRQTVAIMLPTSPAYFHTYLGILRAGGIPVPIYPPARPSQLEDHVRRHTGILDNAQAVLLVSVPPAMSVARLLQARVPGLRGVLDADELMRCGDAPEPVPVHAEDVAFIQYTSGSTGQPKGVALTHANLLANIDAMAGAIAATADDVFVSWLPLYHDMGLIGAWLGSLTVGFPLVVMSPLAFLARPRRWLEAMTAYRGTLSAGPNFAYELCLARIDGAALAGLDLSHWRLAFNGAEAVSPDTVTRFVQRFAACGLRPEAMTPVYGLAEASVGLLFPPLGRGPRIDRIERRVFAHERRAEPAPADDAQALAVVACGRALPGHAVRIVGEQGIALGERREGRLEFRGPSATSGYWRAPELSARLIGPDGWLDTGDRAYAAEGDVFVTGRVKDIVIRGGRNLYPQEIEEAVGAVAGIRKGCVAVFGRPDARTGTERLVVLAEVQPRAARDRAALRDAVARAVVDAIGEPPDDVLLVPPHTVLKTSSGKVRRSACRELVESGRVGGAAPSVSRQWWHLAREAAWWRVRGIASAAATALRDALFGLWMWLLLVPLAPVAWLLCAFAATPALAWARGRRLARVWLRLAGVPLSVHGIEHLSTGRPQVIVCNHSSYLDGIALIAALPLPCAFVAKRELAGQRVAGRFLRGLGAVFVERFDPKRSVADAAQLAELLRGRGSLLVFPEGTFGPAEAMLPFHLGGFLAAAQAGVPVLPVALSGTRRMLPDGRWWPRWGRLAVNVGAPIEAPTDADAFAAAARLRDAARGVIERGLERT